MASLSFGDMSADMRDQDYYGVAELAASQAFLEAFVPVNQLEFWTDDFGFAIRQFDASGNWFDTVLYSSGGSPYSAISIRTSSVWQTITGALTIDDAGNIEGTVVQVGIRFAAGGLIVLLHGTSLPFDSKALEDDAILLAGDDLIRGGVGNDYLDGYAGNDTLEGGGGNDTYVLNSFIDRIVESAQGGDDTVIVRLDSTPSSYFLPQNVEHVVWDRPDGITLNGSASTNILRGNAGDDSLNGSDGADTLIGAHGNDTLHGGTDGAIDRLEGGPGDDLYLIGEAGELIIELPGEGLDVVEALISFRLPANVENLRFGAFVGDADGFGNEEDNVLSGSAGQNRLDGGLGDDVLTGGMGYDVLIGGEGNDVLWGTDGLDILIGGRGDDVYVFDDWRFRTNQVVELPDEGIDTIRVTGIGNVELPTTIENLIFDSPRTGIGNAGNNRMINGGELWGRGGDDYLKLMNTGDSHAYGEEGNDTLVVEGPSPVQLFGGPGDDTYDVKMMVTRNFTMELSGEPGNALLDGETLVLTPDDERLGVLLLSDHSKDGIPDFMTLSFQGPGLVTWSFLFQLAPAGLNLQPGTFAFTRQSAQAGPGSPAVSITHPAAVSGPANGEVTIHSIDYDAGANIQLRAVDFEFIYSSVLNGTSLEGRVRVLDETAGVILERVVESVDEGNDTLIVDTRDADRAAIDLADLRVENLIAAGSARLDVAGSSAANVIEGTTGDNSISGGEGDDVLRGFAGNDVLDGGEGADLLDGGSGIDAADFSSLSTGVVIGLNVGRAIDANGAIDTLIDVENVIGSAHDDFIVGVAGVANVTDGGDGDDILLFDSLDTLSGGVGIDRAILLGSTGVTLTMSDIEWFWGSSADDIADASVQTASVTIFGMDGNDTLTGGFGDDHLYGQDGADALIGGDGDDWLYIDSQDIASGIVQGGGGTDRAASLDGSAVSIDLAASTIEWIWASNGGDNLDGTTQSAPLVLFAFGAADVLRGGSGNDNLYGMAGADAMYGGAGNDVLYFDSDDIVVDGGADYDVAQVLDYTGIGVALNLATSQIEAVYASNQADTLDASAATWAVYMNGYNGDDVMSGGSGDDNIYGGGGADSLSGGGGNDFLDAGGGPEVDTLVVSGANVEYILHYTGGTLTSVQDLVGGRDGWDNVAGFEKISFSDGAQIL